MIVVFPDHTHLLFLTFIYIQFNLVNSSSDCQVFAVLFIHTNVNSNHTFILFLILSSWETDI